MKLLLRNNQLKASKDNANTMNRNCRFDMFVVRLARNDETQSKHNTQMVQNNIDGVAFNGYPSQASRFNPGEDYYSVQGWTGPTELNGAINPGVTVTNAYDLVSMNTQRYKVVHKRSFVLGRTANPFSNINAELATTAAGSTVQARDYYETSFTINYGGKKVMPYDTDGVDANDANITIDDIKYSELDRHIKHWIVIFPSRDVSDSAGQGIPVMSLLSTCTTRVPT